MGADRAVHAAEIAAKDAEIAKFREILKKIVETCGGSASTDCSMEFWAIVPKEVRLGLRRRDAEIARLREQLAEREHTVPCDCCDAPITLDQDARGGLCKRCATTPTGDTQ